ncbi:MAG: NADH-quinone oxidoreductase subunit L [Aliihoeflea sp.]
MHSILFIVFVPLVAAIVAGFANKSFGATLPKAITTGGLFLSCALSWPVFIGFLMGSSEASVTPVLHFMTSGTFDVSWAMRVDALTAVMLVVITSVSALVHLYSWGYMSEDPDQPRFFAYLSLFTFAMLMLVTADNLIQMFFGWEGVGLASYLLIGFWFRKPSANAAAIKAFVVNRVGDLGFMLGIFGTYLVFNTVSIPAILAAAPSMAGSTIGFLWFRADTMTVLCLLLFVGAMGKSAQLGLHTWLPDAMEGPTPVSALIHAATMVTAGVFMVCRLSPMFETSPTAMGFVTFIGAATCLFAATIGTTQTDIKRVIAYSTCSQLGYMFFAAGVGAYGAAMFHLFTHAFFKALLFLCAGSVIHAVDGEQDMRHMGGLRKHIPITFWTMTVGTLALTGVGIPGTMFGFAGFFSKDVIIESAYASHNAVAGFAFTLLVIAALFTSFYSWRLAFMTFFGKPRASADVMHHVHESPMVMLIPLFVLTVGAVLAGVVFEGHFFGEEYAEFWKGALFTLPSNEILEEFHHVPLWVKWSPFIAMALGFVTAWYFYIKSPETPKRLAETHRGLYQFLLNKWYFDELYDFLFVRSAKALGRFLWKKGDVAVIDHYGPNGIAARVADVTNRVVRLQSGYLYHYAFAMLIGIAGLVTWMMLGSAL